MKRPKIFYGWWIVSACFIISLSVGGFVTFGFTAFFLPIKEEFGWSYTQISLAPALRGVEVGLLAPLLGLIIDRWGPRRLVFLGTICIGLGMIWVSFTNSLLTFYAAYALVAIGISGISPTVLMTALAHWFHKRIGLAAGIMASGFALGGLLVPLVVSLIDTFQWRTSMFVLGIGIWVIGLPLSLLVRHKPEHYGYLPDGDPSLAGNTGPNPATPSYADRDIPTKTALKSRTFWQITMSMALQFTILNAIIVHIMPYLDSVNVPRSIATLVVMGLPLASIIGRLGAGWLSDRYNKIGVATVFLAATTAGIILFSYSSGDTLWMLGPFVILFSSGWGSSATLRVSLIREYFGRKNFGTIFGFMMGTITLGQIFGPVFAGWVFDNWGSYHYVWLIYFFISVLSVILMGASPVFKKKSVEI